MDSKRSEELTCIAENRHDFEKEEALLTPDDHRDESEWRDFLETKVRYYSNAVLAKASLDLLLERADRLPEPKPWVGAEDAVQIDRDMKEILNHNKE